jgi:hypothetical protein
VPVGQIPAGVDPFAPASTLSRVDDQGAVVVEVTPVNLSAAPDEIAFDVAMNTHSVDLNMNLATLATLSTDTGISVQPTLWEAPQGGHHVRGTLVFPADKDGRSVLAGVTRITLTIEGVDAPARVFEWELK